MCGLPPPSSDFGPEMTRSGFAFPLALRSTRVDSTPRSLSNGRRFWHEDGEPAADYANYADADVRPNGQLASLHSRNSRNPRLVPSKKARPPLLFDPDREYTCPGGNKKSTERLKQSALAHAKLDLEIAEEWFPVEQEASQRLDREERAAKTSRGAAKSSSRRSTRR